MPAKTKKKKRRVIQRAVNPVGRPSEFREEYVEQARALAERGLTYWEIGQFLGVTPRTMTRWVGAIPEFCLAIKSAGENVDDRVERSLYERAVGYTFAAEKVFQHKGHVVRADTTEHVPPDPGAAMSWLTNRRSDRWKKRTETDHNITVGFTEQFEQFVRGLDKAPARDLVIEARAVEVIDEG